MIVTLFLAMGSITIGLLGLMHLLFTFQTNKFEPRDTTLGLQLREVSPVITSQTTMWNAWVGFNASHSVGAILFASVFSYLAIFELRMLLSSPFLVALSLVTAGTYVVLARVFWFKTPFVGAAIATSFIASGYLFAYL